MKSAVQNVAAGAAKRERATRERVGPQVAGVDAIEVKATIPEAHIDGALARYNLTVDNDEERFIYFFDTPQLDLLKAGTIIRARRTVGGEHDCTLKFRPVVPSDVSPHWGQFEGFKLEADASETDVVRSASFTMPVVKGLIKKIVAGKADIAGLVTTEQIKFLTTIGKQTVDFKALTVFGPLASQRWQFEAPACPWKITAELWQRGDGKRLMELSIKSPAAQAAVAIAGFMAFLAEVGVEHDLQHMTKTRWAMAMPTLIETEAKDAPASAKPVRAQKRRTPRA